MNFTQAVKTKLVQFFAAVCLLVLPAISFAQVLPPDPGDNDNNPDVPFDSNMNLVFLAVGILFAAFIISRRFSRKTTTA